MRTGILLVLLVSLLPGTALAQDPEAVLMSLTGEVVVTRDGGEAREGSFGMHLFGGDVVRTKAGSSAEIFFSAGNWIEVGAESSMSIRGSKARAPEPAGRPLKSVQRFLALKDKGGTSALSALRSGAPRGELQLVSPVQTKVRAGRPVFTWRADAPTELKLTLYGRDQVVWEGEVDSDTTFVYPEGAPALEDGTTYSWALETSDPLQIPPLRSATAFFELLSEKEDAEVEAALAELPADESVPEWGRELVLASTLYEFGLLSDALRHTEKAAKIAPANPHVRSILARLYGDVGRSAEALAEYEKLERD